MREALYRKYRPKNLKDVVGQEHITKTLTNALESGNIRHAYLFTGPRGVGKTSVARILAHEVNGLEYKEESTHLDIIEIDAASNRKIDEIRDLREKVNIAPTSAKYKVYIIDEVHMLTKEAFNALLKTLEEPPSHVIFILATTESHKVPATIISRTQRFPFRQVDQRDLIAHLKSIAKLEKIQIDEESLKAIASYSEGSVRDAISLLDQVASLNDKVDLEATESLLGLPSQQHVTDVISALQNESAAQVLEATQKLRIEGISPQQFAGQLSKKLRDSIESDNELLPQKLTVELLQRLLLVGTYSEPMSALEVCLLGCLPMGEARTNNPTQTTSEPLATTTEKSSKIADQAATANQKVARTPEASKAELIAVDKTAESGEFDWQSVLLRLKTTYSSLYGLLRMAQAKSSDQELLLTFQFPFHAKQLKQSKNLDKLREALARPDMEIKIEIDTTAQIPITEADEAEAHNPDHGVDIKTVSNIFGDVELLDS